MWWKILLFSLYLLILFILARILETFTYYQTGYLANKLIDPFSLSVQKLKAILDSRGVNYDSALEKRDLSQMVENSGELIECESSDIDASMLNNNKDDSDQNAVVDFIGGDHFLERVEDTKDSVWVVQVLANNLNKDKGQKLNRKEWNKLVKILSKFGIQAGTFNCKKDFKSREWMQDEIILSIPEGNCFKDKVITKTYTGSKIDHKSVLKWVNQILSQKVQKVLNYEQLKSKWLQLDTSEDNKNADWHFNESTTSDICHEKIKVLFVSALKIPPLFYSVMPAKFSGRIKFGHVTFNDEMLNKELFQVLLNLDKINSFKNDFLCNSSKMFSMFPPSESAFKDVKPFYLVITPEKLLKFGSKSGEHFNYKSFSNFLKFLHPEINDIFITSLVIMSFACCFDVIFLSEKKLSNKVIHFLWSLSKCNACLICLWMVVLGTYKSFSQCQDVIDCLLSYIRVLSFSSIGSQMRNDWYQYIQYRRGWCLPLFTFFLVQFAFITVKKKIFNSSENSTNQNTNQAGGVYSLTYLEMFINRIMQSFFSSSEHANRLSTFDPDDVNISDFGMMEMFIERLAVPDLWLRPIVSSQYLHDLPVWRFAGVRCPSTSSNNDSDYSIEHEDDVHSSYMSDDDVCEFNNLKQERMQPYIFICDKCRIALHPSKRKHSLHNKMKEAKDRQSALKLGTIKAAKYLMDGNYKCACKHDDSKSDTGIVSNDHSQNNNTDNENDAIDASISTTEEPMLSPVQKLLASITFKASPENLSTCHNFIIPSGVIESSDCSICLDRYRRADYLCGLPCGHAYHQSCIMSWLTRDNHCCPVCRWPAYKAKPCRKHLDS